MIQTSAVGPLVQAGVRRVFCIETYRKYTESLALFEAAGVEVIRDEESNSGDVVG